MGSVARHGGELALGSLRDALAGSRPGAEADHRLQRVVAGAQLIVLRVQEGQHPVLLVVVQELPGNRPRRQPGREQQRELPPAHTGTEEHRAAAQQQHARSEEHTSELQSLMRTSYAVFCLKKKNTKRTRPDRRTTRKQTKRKQY